MSLEFTIIPITSDFLSFAYDIQTKIKDNVELEIKTSIDTSIDTNYSSLLSTRINKWRKLSHNVVTIDQDYNESHSIVVIFSDKGSRSQVMEVDEFIDLLASFEDNDEDKDTDEHKDTNTDDKNKTDTKSSDDNQDGGCIIM
jgi:threonyl-tRNA synthetase